MIMDVNYISVLKFLNQSFETLLQLNHFNPVPIYIPCEAPIYIRKIASGPSSDRPE